MKILVTIFAFSMSLAAYSAGYKKSIKIDVNLSPAGSFTIESKKIKGKVFLSESGNLSAQNIRIPIKNLNTGLDLRDVHLKKKLGFEKDKKAVLLLVKASGKISSGVATFKVLNKLQTVPFTFKKLSKDYGQADFSIPLC